MEGGSGRFQHGHTYIGHPVACAAALAVQQVIERDHLLDAVKSLGTRLARRLHERFDGHAAVGDIRGRGLFMAIELVADRAAKQPFDPSLQLHARIKSAAMARGLMVYPMGGTIDGRLGDHVLLAPPFISTPAADRRDRRPPRRSGRRRARRGRAGARRPMSVAGDAPVAIAVAPNGARKSRSDHARLPITPAELADCAADCLAAGAAMIHLHVRDGAGRHSLEAADYRAAIDAIRDRVGDALLIQVTTEAGGRYGPAEQMAHARALAPQALSLAVRELWREPALGAEAAAFVAELAVARRPRPVHRLRRRRPGAFPAAAGRGRHPAASAARAVRARRVRRAARRPPRRIAALAAALPPGWPWSVCAFGAAELRCVVTGALLGGHVRVGFENNHLFPSGVPAADNAGLVRACCDALATLGLRSASSGRDAPPLLRSAQSGADPSHFEGKPQ